MLEFTSKHVAWYLVIVSNLALDSKYLEIETMGKCLVTISKLASDSNYSEMETK
jgi:hypothetical protein